ncbi:MAG TPA: UDP-N-acetylglucosamine 1-carboxyvinyltransferase [Planctomycetaceae bacterium]
MDMFVVHGGRRLRGRVRVSGAKNAALPILAAVLASDGPTVLHGVPDLVDVTTLCQLLTALGVEVSRDGRPVGSAEQFEIAVAEPTCDPAVDATGAAHSNGESPGEEQEQYVHFPFGVEDHGEPEGPHAPALKLEVVNAGPCLADYELVRRMRAGICVLGPLLARRGRACVSLPGGCNIGDRPVDLHLKGLAALGADLRVERGYIFARAKRLRGARIYLGGPFGSTVTGTCNVMTAAALAQGVTTIEAAACEPEVVDLGNYLNRMGAKITGLGTPFLHIEGVESLTGCEHTIIPDRIEAATLMIAAAMTRGDVVLENIDVDHMTAVIEKLREIGVAVETVGNAARVTVRRDLLSADCIMLPYPGLPTDVQAQLMALLTTVPGISIITDKVFPDRFMHAAELARMGASIRREGPSAIISGVPVLSGASVMASDLRASAALVLAALAAQGDSVIHRIYHLDRGYDRLEHKLNDLGAGIVRAQDIPLNMPASLSISPAEMAAADDAGHELRGPKWLRSRESLKIHAPEEM